MLYAQTVTSVLCIKEDVDKKRADVAGGSRQEQAISFVIMTAEISWSLFVSLPAKRLLNF